MASVQLTCATRKALPGRRLHKIREIPAQVTHHFAIKSSDIQTPGKKNVENTCAPVQRSSETLNT